MWFKVQSSHLRFGKPASPQIGLSGIKNNNDDEGTKNCDRKWK
jgi:hypothetical protein